MDRKYEWKYEWKIEGWEEWEVPTAKKLVGSFINKGCFTRGDFMDLMQECIAHYNSVRGAYTATRGASKKTYMWRVVTNKLRDLVDKETANKRSPKDPNKGTTDKGNHKYMIKSLYEPVGGSDDRQLVDTITDPSTKDIRTNTLYKMAMKEVIPQLTDRQREIFQLRINGVKVTEIAHQLDIHRSTVHDDLKSIEAMFEL